MSQTAEEDKKPSGDQSAHINLKVKGQDGNEVFFRIKRSTQLKKLMNAYCDRQSVDMNSIAFLFDGRRLGVNRLQKSWRWKTGMRLMQCCIKLEAQRFDFKAVCLSERCQLVDFKCNAELGSLEV